MRLSIVATAICLFIVGLATADSAAAQVTQPSSAANQTSNSRVDSNGPESGLAEIIVTAEKHEERLQDVPIPVTVINAQALTQSNQVHLQDYYATVPGLVLSTGGDADTPGLSIRGITSGGGGGAPSVGVVIDDVPYGSATGLGGRGQPDIDPGDLARVEVLRGPQGTLYGANSMGGLLKFVTIDPSTDALSGRVQAGTSSVYNGIEPGLNFRGSINVPVNDTLAFRASAFREQDPGYIDNIQTGQQGINRMTSDGGRVSVLWKPSDVLSLKLSALLQDSKRDGGEQATVGPGFADLQQSSIPNTQTLDEKTQAYSATLNAKFGGVELTSLTGFNVDRALTAHDVTRVSGSFFSTFGGVPAAVLLDSIGTHRFSEELRLSVPITDQITWLLGGYYADERNDFVSNAYGADAATGTPTADLLLLQEFHLQYSEYAAFTNITYNVTDRFDVQLGGRVSENRQTFDIVRGAPIGIALYCPNSAPAPCPDLTVSGLHSKDTPFTYLFTPRYKISPDLMVYARFASGYRPGGPNEVCTTGIPCQYDAEKTQNYDLGLKGDFLDHILSVDFSLYRIDWKDIQVALFDPTGLLGYTANAGRAKSQGVELSVEARPIRGLTVSAWVAYDDANFTGLPQAGARIPGTTRFTGNVSADEEFALTGSLSAFVGGTMSYVGNRLGGLQGPGAPRAYLPAYAQTNLHAGLKVNTWTVTAFVNNVTDKRGVLEGGLDYQYEFPDPNTYTFITPRTVGLNASKTF